MENRIGAAWQITQEYRNSWNFNGLPEYLKIYEREGTIGRMFFTYDQDNFELEETMRSYAGEGQLGLDNIDWTLVIRREKAHTNGVQTKQRVYFYWFGQGELMSGVSLSLLLDFTVPRSEVVMFHEVNLFGEIAPFKTVSLTDYEFDFGLGPMDLTHTFYWSPAGQTSIQNPNADNAVFVFPNPVVDSFTIGGIEESTLVSITDIHGRVILQQTVSPNESISVSHLSAGIYFVRVNGNVVRIVKK